MSIRIACLTGCLALAAARPLVAEEFPANKLFVCSSEHDRVLVFAENAEAQPSVGAHSLLVEPSSLLFGPDGLLYVLSEASGEVLVFAADSAEPTLRFGPGSGLGLPRGLALLPDGSLAVGDASSGRVMRFTRQGDLLASYDVSGTPSGLACSADGHLLVACSDRDVIQEFDLRGVLLRSLGADSGLEAAAGIAIAGDGRIYVASVTTDSILVLDGSGALLDEIGAGSALDEPDGVALGPDGLIYVASRGSQKIMAFTDHGTVARTFGKKLGTPTGLAFAPFRFKCSTKGSLAGAGDVEKGNKQPAVMSIQPGSRTVMLDFESEGALTTAFGGQSLVFTGIESNDDGSDDAKSRRFHGSVLHVDQAADGVLSLSLVVKGKVDKHDVFEVKSAEGSLVQGTAGSVFLGTATTSKRLK